MIQIGETLRSIRKDLGLTQEDLARESGISRHAVVRMEQHLYPSPLPAVLVYLANVTDYSKEELANRYRDEVSDHRIASGERWLVDTLPMSIVTSIEVSGLHPFAEFRHKVATNAKEPNSQIHFCLAFSIHPYTLSHYEGYKSSFPDPLNEALVESGFDPSLVEFMREERFFNTVITSE